MKYFFIAIGVLLFSVSCGGKSESFNDSNSEKSYEFEFGMKPTTDVKNIHSKQVVVGDACRAWLKFDSEVSTFENLKRRGFQVIPKSEFEAHSGGGNTPNWWKIGNGENIVYYKMDQWKKQFSNSSAVVYYDAESKCIYYCHDANN